MGEHIADYYCLEHYGWGKGNWTQHDTGAEGVWREQPSKTIQGKLSNHGKLFKLTDPPNGKGIDAVWRAKNNNNGRDYAIVEAKSAKSKTVPTYIRKGNTERKPSISSRLGVNGIPEPEDILDPPTEGASESAPAATSTITKGSKNKKRGAPLENQQTKKQAQKPKSPAEQKQKDIIVQMSHEWIDKNIMAAVPNKIFYDINTRGKNCYSRHLFYTPLWLPAALLHEKALITYQNSDAHKNHDIIDQLRYDDTQIQTAISKKKKKLRQKYGNLVK